MRLTKEREQEIRHYNEYGSDDTIIIGELLEEIDALRAELDDSREIRLAIKLVRAEKERDELKAEIDALRGESRQLNNTQSTNCGCVVNIGSYVCPHGNVIGNVFIGGIDD